MQNITDIRHHIRTVEQTRQITRAMYLISVSKRRKAISMAAANTACLLYTSSGAWLFCGMGSPSKPLKETSA